MDQVNEEQNVGNAVVERKTEQGFTPGPWRVEEVKGGPYGRFLCVVADSNNRESIVQILWHNTAIRPLDEANARLIAAAPALYEALKESALAVHTIGAYHHPSWIGFEQCDKPPCVRAREVLALVNKPADESAKRPISDRGTKGQASQTDSE